MKSSATCRCNWRSRRCEWKDCKINLVDAPGYAEFVGEVKAAMRVVDAALIVLDAVGGVEVGALQAWQYADEAGTPGAPALRQQDGPRERQLRRGAQPGRRAAAARAWPPCKSPSAARPRFRGVVDLLHMKAYVYETQKGDGKFTEQDRSPPTCSSTPQRFRDMLIERVAEVDDELTMKYLEGEELTEDEIRQGLLQRRSHRRAGPGVLRLGHLQHRHQPVARRAHDLSCPRPPTAAGAR